MAKRTLSKRTIIRKKIKKLLTGATAAGDRVETNKQDPIWAEPGHLPAIRIYGTNELISERISAPREYERGYNLAISILAIEEDGIDSEDILDLVDQQIRNVLLADNTLGGKVADIVPVSVNMDFGEEGEVENGMLTTIYNCTYGDLPSEDVEDQQWRGVSDFEAIHTKYNIFPDNDADSPKGVIYELEDEQSLIEP